MDPPPYPSHHKYKAVPDSETEDIALPELEDKPESSSNSASTSTTTSSSTTTNKRRPKKSKPSFLTRHLSLLLTILLALTILLLLLAITAAITLQPIRTAILLRLSSSASASLTTRPVLECGSTTAEAEALGCEYDPLAACWMHPDCPHDYTDEFITYNDGNPFHYYYDHEGTREIESWYDLSQLGYYWSSTREHLVHCSFILRRGHDTKARGARVDSMAGDLHHNDHCAQFLADHLGESPEELEILGTYGEVCFLSC